MKRSSILMAVIAILTLLSCGPNAAEKAKIEQVKADSTKIAIDAIVEHKADSVKAATEEEMKNKYQMRETLQSKLQDATGYLQTLNGQLINAKASLDVANSDMDKIKEFHVMRTNSERDQQVRAQSIKIQNIQNAIANIEQSINQQQSVIDQIKTELQKYN